jgi:osmoprotectant transport system permease protein
MSEMFAGIIEYIRTHPNLYLEAAKTHVLIGVAVLSASIFIGMPLGVLSAKKQILSSPIINIFSVLKMIPSLAILIVFIPILGTGFVPAFFALTLHGIPTILVNTYTGFREIDPAVMESANAMGMTRAEIFRKVEMPLAMPLIYSGLRTCTIDIIASATLAAYIGAGGLGTFIIVGLSYVDYTIIMTGSLSIAALTLAMDLLFHIFQRIFIPYQQRA